MNLGPFVWHSLASPSCSPSPLNKAASLFTHTNVAQATQAKTSLDPARLPGWVVSAFFRTGKTISYLLSVSMRLAFCFNASNSRDNELGPKCCSAWERLCDEPPSKKENRNRKESRLPILYAFSAVGFPLWKKKIRLLRVINQCKRWESLLCAAFLLPVDFIGKLR